MNITEYCGLFGIKNEHVKLDGHKDAITTLDKQGYVILHNVVDLDIVEKMRKFWLAPKKKRFSSSISLGEPNYSHKFFGKYTRHFEFYWNKPSDPLTYQTSLLLHYLRNTLLGNHPLYGLTFEPSKVGTYLAITHYSSGSGEMAVHVDPNYFLPTHYVLPLTFKGDDYQEGGLFAKKGKEEIDIESQLRPGSILLFKGSMPHGVKKVTGEGTKTNDGRLQMFSIPTIFDGREKHGLMMDVVYEFFGRFKYFGYAKGKGYRQDNKNFR